MNLEIESYEGELEKLRRVFKMVRHLSAEKLEGVYFICGEAGEKDDMGLPEKILVCPSYGLDGIAIYTKTSGYSAPEY
jgi:hypothetical protein